MITILIVFGKEKCWEALRHFHVWDNLWGGPRNSSSMYNQFVCHVDWAYYKQPWRIEPGTPDKGYWGFVWG